MNQKLRNKEDVSSGPGFCCSNCGSLAEIVNRQKLEMQEHFKELKFILLGALHQGTTDNMLEQLDQSLIDLLIQLTMVKPFVSPEEGECIDQLVFLIARMKYAVASRYQESEILNLYQICEDKLHSFSTFPTLS